MRTTYSRLFTDDTGESRIADFEVELAPGFAVPRAEPLHTAPFLVAENTFWIGAPVNWKGGARHPAPRRAIFVTVRGEFQVTTSDGTTRRFPVGSVLIVEDTTGHGHSTVITSSEDCYALCVGLPPEAAQEVAAKSSG